VREAEALAGRKPKKKSPPARKDPDVRALEERLSRVMGSKVSLNGGRKKGTGSISIQFSSFDDLDRILSLLEKT
jgi:ParB family chromosome partitioning protein